MSKTTNNQIDTDKLRQIVREEVVRALQNLTGDPDAGLELKEEVKEELRKARDLSDEDLVPLGEVKESNE